MYPVTKVLFFPIYNGSLVWLSGETGAVLSKILRAHTYIKYTFFFIVNKFGNKNCKINIVSWTSLGIRTRYQFLKLDLKVSSGPGSEIGPIYNIPTHTMSSDWIELLQPISNAEFACRLVYPIHATKPVSIIRIFANKSILEEQNWFQPMQLLMSKKHPLGQILSLYHQGKENPQLRKSLNNLVFTWIQKWNWIINIFNTIASKGGGKLKRKWACWQGAQFEHDFLLGMHDACNCQKDIYIYIYIMEDA